MKILVILLGRIGDMILATPMFRAIKDKYPDSSLHVLAGRHNFSIIKNNPRINNIIVFEKQPLKLLKTIIEIRKERYDYLLDSKDHYSTESRFIAKISRADMKIGYNRPGSRVFDIGIQSDMENESFHAIERHFNVLKPLDISLPDKIPLPELFPSPDSEDYTHKFINRLENKSFILINLSASKQNRLWQFEKWKELIDSLDNGKFNIILSFAPTEKIIAEDLHSSNKAAILFPSRSIDDVISLVKRAALLITPDTSLVHVASAFDTTIIGLYNGWDSVLNKFKPLSSLQKIIRAEPSSWEISSIKAEEVVRAYRELRLTFL